ncbi:hypothetical protein T265_10553 [Opisthorchis viverrini]|uniref:Uncharacterized protein n=1 Tax=Opisthorchis viverrini TaxID=6198 RepID=A0A074Z220_OPIVI|nr:hypothetical protein T265_10553 [Opisthorchis viverrini]KER21028.1 hypothetical protein T265_10553 [Opisthorchis viverrini]
MVNLEPSTALECYRAPAPDDLPPGLFMSGSGVSGWCLSDLFGCYAICTHRVYGHVRGQPPEQPLTIQGEVLKVVERFTYHGSCISSDCIVTDEINARICEARIALPNLMHLLGRVYQAAVRAVLLYDCETSPVRAAELRCLQVFDSRCLKTIALVFQSSGLSVHATSDEQSHQVAPNHTLLPVPIGTEVAQSLKRDFTDWKVRCSNPTSAFQLSRLGQPDSISAVVLLLGGVASRHRKSSKAERRTKTLQAVIRSLLNARLYCWTKWLEREFTDRKVRGSNPTSATRLPLSRFGQPGSIPALVPSCGMAARHRTETWPLCAEDLKRLKRPSMYAERCPSLVEHRISNAQLRRMVFGKNNLPTIDELITLHRSRWLGHVLCWPVYRLHRRALFAQPCARGGQKITWQ